MDKTNEFRTTISRQHTNQKTYRLNESPKSQLDYIKLIKSIKLEQDLRKIKQFKALEQSIKRDKQEVSQIEEQLSRVQQQIIEKKQQVIKKQLQKVQQHKKQRQQFIAQSNKQLSRVKQSYQQKKKNVQLMLKQEEEKKRQIYQRRLKQRVNRYRNPINFQEIKHHQKKYLELRQSSIQSREKLTESKHIKRSLRVKSQAQNRHSNQFEHLSIDPKSMLNQRIKDQYQEIRNKSHRKRQQLLKMIQKRNDYGNRVQLQMKNNKIKTEPSQTFKRPKAYSNQIFKQSIIIPKKPQVDTNLPKISINDYINMSLKKIRQDKMSDALQKFQKLKNIQNMYNNKKDPQSINLLSQLTLIKADLLLRI